MNSWNPKQVRETYGSQALGFLTRVSPDRVNLNQTVLAHTFRQLVNVEKQDPEDPQTLIHAKEIVAALPPKPSGGYHSPVFGYVAQWLSEIGSQSTLNSFLNHADQFLNPTWEKGGLYYPRNDKVTDEEGNWTHVDPFTGNAGVAYGRLNVEDGQKTMWEKPWTKEEVEGRPWVDGVSLSAGVDVLRGAWVDKEGAMVLTVRTWDGAERV